MSTERPSGERRPAGRPSGGAPPGGPPPGGDRGVGADDRVAVVLLTHERPVELARTLDRLAALPEAPEVIVVDNGTRHPAAGRPGVTVLRMGANRGAAARNVGVERVRTRYVAFCDDDTWWDPGALTRAADALDRHPRLAVVTGRILVEPGGRDDPITAELAGSPLPRPDDAPGAPLLSFLAGASVLRVAAFREAGGFEPRLHLGGEEELLASRLAEAGWAMSYLPDVVAHHQPSPVRDPHLRRRRGLRNTLWFTWLRRPWRPALSRTVWLARTAPHDWVTLAAFADAARGAAWVLARRSPVPEHVEAGYRLLEGPQRRSTARRYVS